MEDLQVSVIRVNERNVWCVCVCAKLNGTMKTTPPPPAKTWKRPLVSLIISVRDNFSHDFFGRPLNAQQKQKQLLYYKINTKFTDNQHLPPENLQQLAHGIILASTFSETPQQCLDMFSLVSIEQTIQITETNLSN